LQFFEDCGPFSLAWHSAKCGEQRPAEKYLATNSFHSKYFLTWVRILLRMGKEGHISSSGKVKGAAGLACREGIGAGRVNGSGILATSINFT
jgi:hypothetical protein